MIDANTCRMKTVVQQHKVTVITVTTVSVAMATSQYLPLCHSAAAAGRRKAMWETPRWRRRTMMARVSGPKFTGTTRSDDLGCLTLKRAASDF